jgi:polyhydroxyalkanoate synthesis regulator phasin
MRKWIAAAVTATALGGAAAGAAVFNVPTIAGAQSTTTAPAARTAPPWMTDALKKLVDAGTINQSQADAVSQALIAAKPQSERHGPGPGLRAPGKHLSAAAKAIGIDETALRDALRSGKTIAQVAQDHGVDVQKVIDALVGDLKTNIAAEVASGHITQAQADKILADAPAHISDLVNGKLPARGPGGPGRHFGPDDTPPTTTG